ncbi:MAG: capsular biosynthesis protein, partial [Pseudomonadota bacterium]
MIVLPMAGLSSRFSKAGYTLPKYMLPLGDGSMLQQVVKGFSSELQRQPFLFICRDVADTEAFITREMEALPEAPREVRIVVLDAETAGQAETVYAGLAAAGVADATPLTIFNIDSQHRAFSYPTEFNIEEVDGYLEVFGAEGTHWSFVRPDTGSEKPGAVAEVAEKLRISDLCSSGLYHFRRAGLFRELFEATLADDP